MSARIQVPDEMKDYLYNKFIWGVNEKLLYIGNLKFKLSTHRTKSSGIFMLTSGAVYIFNTHVFKKPTLKYHIGLLRCRKIELSRNLLLLTVPILRVDKGACKKSNEYTNLPIPIPGYTMLSIEDPDFVDSDDEEDSHDRKKSRKKKSKNKKNKKNNDKKKSNNKKSSKNYEKLESQSNESENNLVNAEPGDENELEDIHDFENDEKNNKSWTMSDHKSMNSTKSTQSTRSTKPAKSSNAKNNNSSNNKNKKKDKKDVKEIVFRIESESNTDYLFKSICKIISAILYGVKNSVKPKIIKNKQKIEFLEKRSNDSLLQRAICVSHFSFLRGEYLECANYFQEKWSGQPSLVIGPNFHPGGFGLPFGISVGFETAINSVVFKHANFEYLNSFLSGLLISTQTVSTIGITDYPIGTEISLQFLNVRKTSVSSWVLLNCCANMIKNFANATGDLPEPIRSLTIGKYSYNEDDTREIFSIISSRENLKSLKQICFSSLNFNRFPKEIFAGLCAELSNLEQLELSRINTDGSIIFEAACQDAPHINQLIMKGLKFESSWLMKDKIKLPSGLILLDLSECYFNGTTLSDLLQNVTHEITEIPFFFVLRSIQIAEKAYESLKDNLDLKLCQPNILEFDMSNCVFPTLQEFNTFDPIFSFISTQKRIRNLIFTNVMTDNQLSFAHKITSIKGCNNLTGIDFSGEFNVFIMQQFITSVSSMKNLKHLSLKKCGVLNRGYRQIENFLDMAHGLREIEIDGFHPELINEPNKIHPLISCWNKIRESTSIVANDLPISDLNDLGFIVEKMSPDEIDLKKIKDAEKEEKKKKKKKKTNKNNNFPNDEEEDNFDIFDVNSDGGLSDDGVENNTFYNFDEKFNSTIKKMLIDLASPNRSSPSTMDERLAYLYWAVKKGDEDEINLAISPEIFLILHKKDKQNKNARISKVSHKTNTDIFDVSMFRSGIDETKTRDELMQTIMNIEDLGNSTIKDIAEYKSQASDIISAPDNVVERAIGSEPNKSESSEFDFDKFLNGINDMGEKSGELASEDDFLKITAKSNSKNIDYNFDDLLNNNNNNSFAGNSPKNASSLDTSNLIIPMDNADPSINDVKLLSDDILGSTDPEEKGESKKGKNKNKEGKSKSEKDKSKNKEGKSKSEKDKSKSKEGKSKSEKDKSKNKEGKSKSEKDKSKNKEGKSKSEKDKSKNKEGEHKHKEGEHKHKEGEHKHKKGENKNKEEEIKQAANEIEEEEEEFENDEKNEEEEHHEEIIDEEEDEHDENSLSISQNSEKQLKMRTINNLSKSTRKVTFNNFVETDDNRNLRSLNAKSDSKIISSFRSSDADDGDDKEDLSGIKNKKKNKKKDKNKKSNRSQNKAEIDNEDDADKLSSSKNKAEADDDDLDEKGKADADDDDELSNNKIDADADEDSLSKNKVDIEEDDELNENQNIGDLDDDALSGSKNEEDVNNEDDDALSEGKNNGDLEDDALSLNEEIIDGDEAENLSGSKSKTKESLDGSGRPSKSKSKKNETGTDEGALSSSLNQELVGDDEAENLSRSKNEEAIDDDGSSKLSQSQQIKPKSASSDKKAKKSKDTDSILSSKTEPNSAATPDDEVDEIRDILNDDEISIGDVDLNVQDGDVKINIGGEDFKTFSGKKAKKIDFGSDGEPLVGTADKSGEPMFKTLNKPLLTSEFEIENDGGFSENSEDDAKRHKHHRSGSPRNRNDRKSHNGHSYHKSRHDDDDGNDNNNDDYDEHKEKRKSSRSLRKRKH